MLGSSNSISCANIMLNGAAATTTGELATIFLNTTIAPAVATCVTINNEFFSKRVLADSDG